MKHKLYTALGSGLRAEPRETVQNPTNFRPKASPQTPNTFRIIAY